MGYAIQRGATCTVAAVDEVVSARTFGRLRGLGEAALWVAGGLVVAEKLQLLAKMPAGYAVSSWTVIGGALLGLGAYVNGACVFGAIARFGSGEWAYVLTPLGFYLGCLSVGPVFAAAAPAELAQASPVLRAAPWLVPPFLAFALWRLASGWQRVAHGGRARWHERVAAHVWSPHAATTVIGLAFIVLLLLVGGWAYTDVLSELARGMSASVGARAALAVALLAGAALGGWTAGRFRSEPPSPTQLGRCLAGGALMGWGSLLLPGGNDGLILVGMPLAWPYAWVAFATMCVTIATVQLAGRAWATQPPDRNGVT
ncbi:MAG: YeeE/YedE family protein, partial [Rhizobacter sp.]|nr:YeeE/YedE family protein [Rhizobacter sp.]